MASTKSPIEREELIEKVGKKFIETGLSARQLAGEFNISNVTASQYLKKYAKNHPDLYVEEKINNIKGNIKDVEIQKRVLASAELCLKGYIIDDIAKIFNVTSRVTYDDLTLRLPKIDEETAKAVKNKLSENKMSNLKNQGRKK